MNESLGLRWYVLVVNPGQEFRVRDDLIGLSNNEKFKKHITDVRVISEKVKNKNGREVEKIMDYKGYVFIKMVHTNEVYNAAKLQSVRHILGGPSPISDEEAKKLFG